MGCSHLELAHVGVARHAAHLDAGRAASGERIGAEKALDRDAKIEHEVGGLDGRQSVPGIQNLRDGDEIHGTYGLNASK